MIASWGTPAYAQIAMPSAQQMSGIPRPVDDVADGTIVVRLVREQLSNNIPNHQVELHGDAKVLTARTDESGRATFTGVPAGTVVQAIAVVDGERLESQPFPAPQRGGIRLLLAASAHAARESAAAAVGSATTSAGAPPQPGAVTLGGDSRVLVEILDDAIQVYQLYDVVNSARTPVTTQPLVFGAPPGAQSATVLEGSSPQATARAAQVIVTGPFPPGATPVHFAYQIPYSSGTLTVAQKMPAALQQVAVAVMKVGNVRFTSPQLGEQRQIDAEGRTFMTASGGNVPAGGTLSLELAGLPHRTDMPRWIALGLALLVLGLGAWAAVPVPAASDGAAREQHLRTRREKLFADLVKLEAQWRAGRGDRVRYAGRRQELIGHLEKIYSELDHELAPGAGESAPRNRGTARAPAAQLR